VTPPRFPPRPTQRRPAREVMGVSLPASEAPGPESNPTPSDPPRELFFAELQRSEKRVGLKLDALRNDVDTKLDRLRADVRDIAAGATATHNTKFMHQTLASVATIAMAVAGSFGLNRASPPPAPAPTYVVQKSKMTLDVEACDKHDDPSTRGICIADAIARHTAHGPGR
jgi:hypothetical protein